MKRPGLRARVTAGFAIGALVVSAAVALLSYQLTERFLLQERERSAVRATYLEAGIVRAGLSTDHPDIAAVLRALDTGGKRRAVLFRDGRWYGRNADFGTKSTIPLDLQDMVNGGQPGAQRIRIDTGPAIVVGVPLDASTVFYVVDSMQELNRSLQVLAIIITLVAAATTAGGAALGWYAARYVVRPMSYVVSAADNISAGDFTARLDPGTEPDLARLATSFNKMVDQLSARMQRDRRFAADVSHELRSPLQTLSAAASVLLRQKDHMSGRAAAAAVLVSEEAERFQDLVTDLLELSRSDQPAEPEPTDIAELARGVCRTQKISEGIVTVRPGTDVIWMIDRRRFQQILANLIENARHHGGGATAIDIGQRDESWLLDVDDEGPGVSPLDRAIIFDRFVRGRTASARGDNDGAGLGLAIVHQHVTAHAGTVTVTDRPGGGARFRIALPRTSQ
ncbi:two-component sensor histidine kinase [Rhizocola hellebori]|uniref:histidine kinase n=1 Tax=Rhizocola hellebori TaxID=1392758 RepID=A0A8J3Q8X3_9ACTN|nr:HAMP domain-containing sensor histidine kinase [Rhizocola hellebori]GIH05240.1 two-component sensor histidine kinase [Rhizocola hellebori]